LLLSLSKAFVKKALEKALKIVRKWGPSALPVGLQVLDYQKEGKAWKEQEKTLAEVRDALLKVVENVQPREIRVIPEAFNSTPTFLDYYQMAALGAIPLAILQAASAIKKVGKSLDGIKSELANGNALKVMGCDGGLGSYVHRFVKVEMTVERRTSDGADDQHHYFYVWNPDTIWYDEFEERQRQDPLGPAFGGYHHDLATICLRMRSDRQALIETTNYGHTAVLHLIIPTYHPLVVEDPIVFAEELLPLVITGRRHQGVDLVWLNLHQPLESQLDLDFISIFYDQDMNFVQKWGTLGMAGSFCGALGCSVAAAMFPPCAPLAAQLLVPLNAAMIGGTSGSFAGTLYANVTEKSTQVLGNPEFLTPSHD
jgi:hypothetical protein